MKFNFFRCKDNVIYLSGFELVQLLHQNKLSKKQISYIIEYIQKYPNYKIQVLDVFKILLKKKKYFIFAKEKWIIEDIIINYTNSILLLPFFVNPVIAA